ncbi:MAG: class I SAM-dependent methyltransferase [Bacteroidia bacterium]
MIYEEKLNSRWADIAAEYDKYRLSPPDDLIKWLKGTSNKQLNLVADLGCGTGRSTRPWGPFSKQVIGVEPSESLLKVANQANTFDNVSFKQGFGSETGLESNSVDIVAAMHSIHWMEPHSTLNEILRILKSDGLFVMYAHELAPTSMFLELEQELFKLKNNIRILTEKHELETEIKHLGIMDFGKFATDKNCFKYSRYFSFGQKIVWNADDYIGWIYTMGNVQKLLKDVGISQEELGLIQFENVLRDCFQSGCHEILINWKLFLLKDKV